MLVADFHVGAERARRRIDQEAQVADHEPSTLQGRPVADGNGVVQHVEAGDIDGLPGGYAQSAALTDGEVGQSLVAAQHIAPGIDDVTGAKRLRTAVAYQAGVVAVRDKADLH